MDTGGRSLVSGSWSLVSGGQSLTPGYWLPVTGYWRKRVSGIRPIGAYAYAPAGSWNAENKKRRRAQGTRRKVSVVPPIRNPKSNTRPGYEFAAAYYSASARLAHDPVHRRIYWLRWSTELPRH